LLHFSDRKAFFILTVREKSSFKQKEKINMPVSKKQTENSSLIPSANQENLQSNQGRACSKAWSCNKHY